MIFYLFIFADSAESLHLLKFLKFKKKNLLKPLKWVDSSSNKIFDMHTMKLLISLWEKVGGLIFEFKQSAVGLKSFV